MRAEAAAAQLGGGEVSDQPSADAAGSDEAKAKNEAPVTPVWPKTRSSAAGGALPKAARMAVDERRHHPERNRAAPKMPNIRVQPPTDK